MLLVYYPINLIGSLSVQMRQRKDNSKFGKVEVIEMMISLHTAAALLLFLTAVVSYTPSPPPYPPKSLSSRSQSKTSTQPQSSWSQGKSDGNRRKQQPLCASTVADNSKPLWKSLWNIPSGNLFTEFAAQFGMEGMYLLLSFMVHT